MTTAQILRDAAALVEEGWTQRAHARNAVGQPVPPTSALAVCWCLNGAIAAAAHAGNLSVGEPARIALRKHLGILCIVNWGDTPGRTKEESVAALRKAAELAEAGGAL